MRYHSDEEIINGMMDWIDTDRPERFDPSFIESVHEYFEEHGTISSGQRNALDNIVDKFDIDIDQYL